MSIKVCSAVAISLIVIDLVQCLPLLEGRRTLTINDDFSRILINGTGHRSVKRPSVIFQDLVNKMTAKIAKRELDKSDQLSTVTICGCERLIKLYEDIKEPKMTPVDTPANCPHDWQRRVDHQQIPVVYYEAICRNQNDCCRTRTGDYNCAAVRQPTVVLRRTDDPISESGCCQYRPQLVELATSCACVQNIANVYDASSLELVKTNP